MAFRFSNSGREIVEMFDIFVENFSIETSPVTLFYAVRMEN